MEPQSVSNTAKVCEFNDLHDEFAAFTDYCAFLCDAMSCLLHEATESEPDMRTVMGLRRQCSDLKARAQQLEALLVNIAILK